jgi:hypothetical protein
MRFSTLIVSDQGDGSAFCQKNVTCTARCSPNVAEAGFSLVFCMSWFGGKRRLVPRDMPEVEHLRNVSIELSAEKSV